MADMEEYDDEQLVNELAPNAPGIFVPEENPELHDEEAEEEAKLAGSLPVVQDMLTWLDEQIALCDSVAQVHNTVKAYDLDPTVDLPAALVAHDIVRRLLIGKRTDLANAFERFMHDEEM